MRDIQRVPRVRAGGEVLDVGGVRELLLIRVRGVPLDLLALLVLLGPFVVGDGALHPVPRLAVRGRVRDLLAASSSRADASRVSAPPLIASTITRST